MSTHDTHHADTGVNYLNASKGIGNWLLTLDHKRIGLMYLWSVMFFLLVGGTFALLIRLQLAFPGHGFLPQTAEGKNMYNEFFTLHGVIMVFLVIIPGIPAALGNFFLPLQLGAKDVAFPKLNLASFYLYWIGAIMAIVAILGGNLGWWGRLDTGWTFYTSYSLTTSGPVILAVSAAFILGFSSIFTGLNFVATIHKMRCPGMGWYRMPLFLWAVYATAIIQVLATPVLGITLLLLIMERCDIIHIFNPAKGGDPILFQHFFWFYSHPAVYIMILPGMGVISEIISAQSKKVIFGYKAIANSSIAIAVISFVVWGHHMFMSGQTTYAGAVFSFLTFAVAIPTAIKVCNWVATLYQGSISLDTPMLYALSFLFLFTIGGLTGIPLATLSTDIVFHDTYYVVAHFHYVMFGGTIIAFFAGLHYWWPKMFGRMYNEFIAKCCCLTIFVGFNLCFFTQFFLGFAGFPRRYYSYGVDHELGDVWRTMSGFSSIGAMILGFGVLVSFVNLIVAVYTGKKASDNPWGGTTLEWTAATPPPTLNFDHDVSIDRDPYIYGKNTGHH